MQTPPLWDETHEGGHVACAEALGIKVIYVTGEHVMIDRSGHLFTDLLVGLLGGWAATRKGFRAMPKEAHTWAAKSDLAQVEEILLRWPEPERDAVMLEAMRRATAIVERDWARVQEVAAELAGQ